MIPSPNLSLTRLKCLMQPAALPFAFLHCVVLCSAFFLYPQKVTGQRHEINNLVQKRTTVEEKSAIMKELTTLREQLVSKSEELKVGGTDFLWQYEP